MKKSTRYALWVAGVSIFHLLAARRIEGEFRGCGAPFDWIFFWKSFTALVAITAFVVWDRWPKPDKPNPETPEQAP